MPRAAPLSTLQKADLPRVELPFSSFVTQQLVKLSADLHGGADSLEVTPSVDHGLQNGETVPTAKARMDAYRVGRNVFSYAVSSISTRA